MSIDSLLPFCGVLHSVACYYTNWIGKIIIADVSILPAKEREEEETIENMPISIAF